MCSIFGFIGRGISKPDIGVLKRIIQKNIQRGPHAFGMAWIDSAGRLHAYKQTGKFTEHLGILAIARDAKMLIGHLRYATHGAPEENINNHPHPVDGGWLVHNGVIRNYETLLSDENLSPVSSCDSEVLGLLAQHSDGQSNTARLVDAVGQTCGNLATLAIWRQGVGQGQLVAIRRGNPLHLADNADGTYLATLSEGLPGKVFAVRDDSAITFTRKNGQIAVGHRRFESVEAMEVSRGIQFADD